MRPLRVLVVAGGIWSVVLVAALAHVLVLRSFGLLHSGEPFFLPLTTSFLIAAAMAALLTSGGTRWPWGAR